jgi:hypothetical protein
VTISHYLRELRPPRDVPLDVDDDPWPVESDGTVVVRVRAAQVNALASPRRT